jgi:hypothetical protein
MEIILKPIMIELMCQREAAVDFWQVFVDDRIYTAATREDKGFGAIRQAAGFDVVEAEMFCDYAQVNGRPRYAAVN